MLRTYKNPEGDTDSRQDELDLQRWEGEGGACVPEPCDTPASESGRDA